ncbi:hypothetical protein SAMN05216532_0240 [Streptomyces sp. 2231.1]|uniref:hypothetical protein n=1 Tax=Streptomyces sp. 2231.1 TaxID=1855347 RepID=UPI0008998005|nr:hypothetical protein [Streptomyces sp. 2231.1]SEC02799.1 hypothetical protein SAMN05216532_0240 [Streptomyces sp. 2231.1]
MRKFQRAAVVAAAVAGLSAFGGGVSFAGGNDGGVPVTAVANSSAVAVGGGYYYEQPQVQAPSKPAAGPEEHKHSAPEHASYGQHAPEQAYGQHEGDDDE